MKPTLNFCLGLSFSLLLALFACQEVAEPVTLQPVADPAASLRTAGEELTLKDFQEGPVPWSKTLRDIPSLTRK